MGVFFFSLDHAVSLGQLKHTLILVYDPIGISGKILVDLGIRSFDYSFRSLVRKLLV